MGRNHRAGGSTAAQQSAQAAIALAVGTGAASQLVVRSAGPLGSLWAGYGSITEVETEDGQLLIIKDVSPPSGSGISHRRKLQSYQVEASFYAVPGGVASRLPPGAACHLPRCLGVHCTLGAEGSGSGGMQLVMADLRPQFPNRWVGGLMHAGTGGLAGAVPWAVPYRAHLISLPCCRWLPQVRRPG